MSRSRITIREVAAHAGVSHQTVSRVINGSERVNPETRERVEAAIAELGYSPNAVARSMARGRTCMLGCIAPNLTDYTFASVIEGAERQARQSGYYLVSSSAKDAGTFASLVEELVSSRRIEGLLVINPYADDRHKYVPVSFPVVYIGARPRGEQVSSVSLDDVDVARQATRHLLELGHHHIAMITGPMEEDCSQDRYQGYKQALQEGGSSYNPDLVFYGDWSATSGYEAFDYLMGRTPLPTAVFAQNDRMAVGLIRAAREAGMNVPGQLSVVGVDDMPLASYFDPPLTTMRQEIAELGGLAARILIKVVEEQQSSSEHFSVLANLVVRQSTAPTCRDDVRR
ncbi:MAG: LacI family DNA-binding transcriptional regulator [Chloroflexota bacterium]